MAGKRKLKKFADVTSFSNVLEAFTYDEGYLHVSADERIQIKGLWSSRFFKNENPIHLELACGKGEYTLGLADLYPDRNYVGIDIKGNRIWTGAKRALHDEVENVGFLRSRIEFLESYFEEDEASEIWIIFPDPFLKSKDENRRLTSVPFLDRYRKVLKNGSLLHLKTDNEPLYMYTLESIEAHDDFKIEYKNPDIDRSARSEELAIKTYYEKQHLKDGRKIKYIRARLHK